jgi:hypothetical protein
MLGLTYPDVSAGFIRGIQNKNLHLINLPDPEKAIRQIFSTACQCKTLTRRGEPHLYSEYFSRKDFKLKPPIVMLWHFLNPKAVMQALKKYEDCGNPLYFFIVHTVQQASAIQAQMSKMNMYALANVTFKRSVYTTDMAKEMEIIHWRMAHSSEEGAWQTAQKKINEIRQPIPLTLSVYSSSYAAAQQTSKTFTLPGLTNTPEAISEWLQVAEEFKKAICTESTPYQLATHRNYLNGIYQSNFFIPDLSRLPCAPPNMYDTTIKISHRLKPSSHNLAGAFLALDNATFQHFNSAQGRPTGLADALLSRPNLLARGIEEAEPVLEALGYKLHITDDLKRMLARRKKFFERQATPLHELKGHELVAYFDHKLYCAKEDCFNPETNQLIWKKGRYYEVVPTWRKETLASGEEPIVDAANNIVGVEELAVNYSVLVFKVMTETGEYVTIGENECRHHHMDVSDSDMEDDPQ